MPSVVYLIYIRWKNYNEKSEKVEFVIKDTGEIQKVIMYDQPIIQAIKTGDSSADIPPIIEMKNPARSPSVVHSISETARKAAEACDFFT